MAIPKTIDPVKMYQVKVSAVVELHPGIFAKPGDDMIVISGSALEAIKDKVSEAVVVENSESN